MKNRFQTFGLICLTLLTCVRDARAEEPLNADATDGRDEPMSDDGSRFLYERGGLLGAGVSAGLKLGAGFSQPFDDLGSAFATELEVGYLLPFADRSLAIIASGAYSAPKAEGKGLTDARLPGSAQYALTQQTAAISLGLTYRLRLPLPMLRPYASLGPRLFLMRTKIDGSAGGQAFGPNEETVTRVGLFGALGAELHFGPGAALLELSLAWARIDNYVLRDTSVGALSISLGYRIFL